MNNILGNLYKGIGYIIDIVLKVIIYIVNALVSIFSSVRQAIGLLFSMGGCLMLIFFFNPYVLIALLSNPLILLILAMAVIIPFAGRIAVSYLKYIHYMATEFFYDKADYYLLGRKTSYENMQGYGEKYRREREEEQRRAEEQRKRAEEQRRRAEEERRRRQQEEWERNFGGQGTYWDFGDFSDFFGGGYSQQGQGNNQRQTYTSPSFKAQYEEACDLLGVPYTADKYEIKLAYKKMAKLYHPDLNKEAGATEMFQKINNANDFLSDENIQRYKNMTKTN